ncbi:MAG TPA: serine/threonine-protein kinase, partial [Thermoanaerobaculia bacterium]|nr:serine/threonine-protein kinase [Thermoanaerobaculia bacterium]
MTNGLGKISRFDLREKIAESSFAVVYKAFDPETSALVAVKLCVATDAALRERFLRAAQAAASLSHPHIARILEFGSGGDRPYLVEEFLAGTDLREYLKHRRLGAGTNEIRMLVQIARALQYAHRRGVPHLDLKPATVHLEGGQDEIKLVDFGIARLASAALSLGSPGTLPPAGGYLAPEQALGLPPDERTDVYCFGALAYQILTGRPPFEGKTLAEVARKTLEEDPVPVGSSWGDCPAELEVMVERCLSKSPGDRYGSFDDVLLDLVPTLEALRTNSTGEFLRVVEETRPGDETSFTQQAVSLDDTVEVPVPIEEVPAEPEDDDTLEDRLVTAIFTPEVPPSLASTPRP